MFPVGCSPRSQRHHTLMHLTSTKRTEIATLCTDVILSTVCSGLLVDDDLTDARNARNMCIHEIGLQQIPKVGVYGNRTHEVPRPQSGVLVFWCLSKDRRNNHKQHPVNHRRIQPAQRFVPRRMCTELLYHLNGIFCGQDGRLVSQTANPPD